MTSIYDAIRADHERHRDLLARIADTTGDSAERRDAFNRLGDHLERLTKGEGARVVALRRA